MIKPTLIVNKKYQIIWQDTYNYLGWHDINDIDIKTVSCLQETVGFFIKETKDFYIFAMHKNVNSGFMPYGLPVWIPKGSVKKIKNIDLK